MLKRKSIDPALTGLPEERLQCQKTECLSVEQVLLFYTQNSLFHNQDDITLTQDRACFCKALLCPSCVV